MSFLYHRVPEDMRGSVLYPLNVLKNVYPDIYGKEVKRYESREFVLDIKIPILDCLWNDVLHLSPVHPQLLAEAMRSFGGNPALTSFQIDAYSLDPEKTIVFLYTQEQANFQPPAEDFVPYDPDKVGDFSALPEQTKEYFKDLYNKKDIPRTWHRVPHILYKGNVDTKNLSVVSV